MLKEGAEKILLRDYTDIEIVDRKEELKELKEYIISPLLDQQTLPMVTYIYGSSGSGKTFLIKKLEDEILKARNIFKEFFYIYFNASKYSTPSFYSILLEIFSAISKFFPYYIKKENGYEKKVELPKRGVSPDEMIKILKQTIEKYKTTILVVIDEIDKFNDYEKVIKWFVDTRAEYDDFWGITAVFISNDPYFLDRLNFEVRTRLPIKIHFTPYSVQDFFEIAKLFISKTFKKPLSDDIIIKIAKKVNEVTNSVRDLKATLYFFGKKGKIEEEEEAIDYAIDKAQMEIFKKEIILRPLQEKLALYAIASQHKKISESSEKKIEGLIKYTLEPTIKNIYDEYRRIGEKLSKINPLLKPRKYTTFFNILKNLENAQLIRIEVKGMGRGQGKSAFVYPKNVSWEYYYNILSKEFEIKGV